MTTCKIILIPTTKEPKISHALAVTSAFNLKLCLKQTYSEALLGALFGLSKQIFVLVKLRPH